MEETASPSPSPEGSEEPRHPKRVMRQQTFFHGEVDKPTKNFIRNWLARAGRYFEMRRPAPRFSTGVDVTVFGYEASAPSDVCAHSGVTGGISIFLASQCWEPQSTEERKRILAHEMFHALQHQLVVDVGAVPVWLVEGTAEYAAVKAAEHWGLVTYDETRNRYVQEAGSVSASLKTMAKGRGWVDSDPYGRQYAVAFLAAEQLVEAKNWKRAARYFLDMATADVSDWKASFRRVFGMSPKKFYRDFKEHRAAGFPGM